ncbi:MAG: PQQ-dependent dehydrogenase, methanol/ethanol family [Oceanococcaceae bacterium]
MSGLAENGSTSARTIAPVLLAAIITGCGPSEAPPASDTLTAAARTLEQQSPAAVDGTRIANADAEPHNWMSHGRTYDEQRFSPLNQINAETVKDLGLEWTYKLEIDRGIEATPIVVDGVMYTTGAFSMVYAFDARNGKLLWKYDPAVPRDWAGRGCCGVINRGVAVWDGKVYVGVYDGRLEALDAATGERLWSTVTTDQSANYTITGAPRIINGKVIIGNGGAELGVRGYVSAYDANSGKQIWRFYTVPGNPRLPPENDAMAMARKTWFGNQWHSQGGGGTVWDSMAYDPALNLLYIGVGNGSPWNIKYRSDGKGDNLFLSSIVALNADTGEYVWHYQTTPGDQWDYTATQHMILAELEIKGQPRKVIMQAPKNGFFYVLDRKNGELLSANNFVPVNWATHVDMETGRPVLTPIADYNQKPEGEILTPSPFGAHNWQPMSFNPDTGLVYIPAQISALLYQDLGSSPQMAINGWNVGLAPFALPEDQPTIEAVGESLQGMLLAWDPQTQQAAWSVPYSAPWNGGTLTTAGNLVFQGTADRRVMAYAADTGEALWEFPSNTGVIAAPMTYAIDGDQYVTFMAGWGGAFALAFANPFEPQLKVQAEARVLTFKLGGKATLPPPKNEPIAVPRPPDVAVDDKALQIGRDLYSGYCMGCHGATVVGNGLVPDLRYMSEETHAQFAAIVAGSRRLRGMPSFGHLLPPDYSALIHQYIIYRANQLYDAVNAQDHSLN